MAGPYKKVVVIGLDGASPSIVNDWIDELPTFQKFQTKGLLGYSIPPIPAQTPVAWTSFLTGKNPGKHGVFSFIQREQGLYKRRIASPNQLQDPTVFQILSEHGKRLCVLNVPMTSYDRINGVMIPGFLDSREGIPQPKTFQEMIKKKFGFASLPGDVDTETLSKAKTNPDRLLNRIFEITEILADVTLHCLTELSWDLFMSVFMGTDRIGHFFWRYMDKKHPQYLQNEFTIQSRRYYRLIDDTLLKIEQTIPEDTLLILVSDHGFCPISKEIYLNNYLQKIGLIETTNHHVNLETSKAIAYGYGDIWLNVRGREPCGIIEGQHAYDSIREAIIQALSELRINGEKPIKKVVKKEDIYWGPRVSEAADLITIFNTNWQAARRPEILMLKSNEHYVNTQPLWVGGHDGTHNPKEVPGILGFLGTNLHRGNPSPIAHLWDVTPTILNTLNLPIPGDLDGKIIPIVQNTE
jgi:predicted AlkP superfamily phosphohydrolase/phosphomutase